MLIYLNSMDQNNIFKKITACRVCKRNNFTSILDLGIHSLTGIFPEKSTFDISYKSPIHLVRCNSCGLIQLEHSVLPDQMFGKTYGYCSSLNSSMVTHLKEIYEYIINLNILNPDEVYLDIGSNDGTLLNFFKNKNLNLIGMDPSAIKYIDKYQDINLVLDYFSSKKFKELTTKKAMVVSAIACFYDLENPKIFLKEILEILDENGVIILEMAYLLDILNNLNYDTCCAEHLLYLSVTDIKNLFDKVGLKIIDVDFNNTNGGSFRVVASFKNNTQLVEFNKLKEILNNEENLVYKYSHYLDSFKDRVIKHKQELVSLLTSIIKSGQTIYGLGASTKFNVLLQYCNIDSSIITKIGDVNPFKYNKMTPGTLIPIVSEEEALEDKPDYMVVGPYHFRESLLSNNRIKKYRQAGGKLIFPLPNIEIV